MIICRNESARTATYTVENRGDTDRLFKGIVENGQTALVSRILPDIEVIASCLVIITGVVEPVICCSYGRARPDADLVYPILGDMTKQVVVESICSGFFVDGLKQIPMGLAVRRIVPIL